MFVSPLIQGSGQLLFGSDGPYRMRQIGGRSGLRTHSAALLAEGWRVSGYADRELKRAALWPRPDDAADATRFAAR